MELLYTLTLMCSSIVIEVKCQANNCSTAGDPFIVTDFLNNGSYIKAQELCKVNPPIGNITSYSGFFTVNKKCNSNIHFWFFPSLNGNWRTKPLVLWLQGGPGSTSMFGLFEEMGPFEFDDKLKMREYTWNNETNILFIDQPVGTGFSYTSNIPGQGCYPENLTATSKDLYQAVYQFYQLFPNFICNNNRFFITGESYAGKWIPSLAIKILENNDNATIKINITALIIGGAYFHPIVQCIYSNYLYNIGLYDYAARQTAKGYEEDLVDYIQAEDWTNAALVCGAQLTGIYDGLAGPINVYNWMYEKDVEEKYRNFVQTCEVQKSLHVGNNEFQSGDKIKDILDKDTVQSVKFMFEALMENITCVFYNGQLDTICAYPMLVDVLRNLTWSGQKDYLNATRTKWCLDEDQGGIQAGFYKGEGNLHEIFFRSAGHYVPRDQPLWAYQFFMSVVTGAPKNPFHRLQPCNETSIT